MESIRKPGQHGLIRRDTPVDAAIHEGLRRTGLTLHEACRAAGVSRNTVYRWREGKGTYWRPLTRFAETIDAPSLFELVPCRGGPRVILNCPTCGRERVRSSGYIEHRQRGEGRFQGIVIEGGRAQWLCKPCLDSDKAHAMQTARRRRIVKKHGRQGLHKHLAQMRGARLKPATGRRGPKSVQAVWNQSIGQIRPTHAGHFGLCSACGYLTFAHDAQGYTEKGPDRHNICPHRARQRGRRFTSGELAAAFGFAVRHLIRGEPIGRSSEEGGQGLAAEAGLDEETVRHRISRFLDLLPPDDRGGQPLARWAKALRWARGRRELHAWARLVDWPWTRVLRQLSTISGRRRAVIN